MEKKKVFMIGGIVILSIVSFFLLTLFAKHLFTEYESKNQNYASGVSVPSFLAEESSYDYDLEQNANTYFPTMEDSSDSVDRSIIKYGDLRVLADDIDETVEEIDSIAKKYQAESQNTYDQGKGKNRNVMMVYKVKVVDFEKFFKELKSMDVDFESTSSEISDVTKEVIDLEARLKTYRNTEAQLLEIQKTATTVTDTMAVYKELNSTRYEIERVESQLKYYSNQTDYSTVAINVAQNNQGAMIEDDTWKPLGVLKNALRAFVGVLKSLGSITIWLVVFGIPVVVIVFLVKYIVKKVRK